MAVNVVTQAKDGLAFIDVNMIRSSKEALRECDRENVQYLELAEAIKLSGGPLTPISVRVLKDDETGEEYYGLIDGLQRLTATRDAGIATIPALIKSSTDYQVLYEQIMANVFKVETKPAEYAQQLQRILQADPTLTASELSAQLGKGPEWVKQRLNLVKLKPEVASLVDSNAINLANAFGLAKLPLDEQEGYLEQAQAMPAQEFTNLVVARLEDLKKAKREGKTTTEPVVFRHKPYLRKVGDIVQESETGAVGASTIATQRLTSAEDGWKAALLWASTSDADSVAAAKLKWDTAEAERAEKKRLAELDRTKRKEGAASVKSARAKLELDLSEKNASKEEIAAELAAFDEAHKPATATK